MRWFGHVAILDKIGEIRLGAKIYRFKKKMCASKEFMEAVEEPRNIDLQFLGKHGSN